MRTLRRNSRLLPLLLSCLLLTGCTGPALRLNFLHGASGERSGSTETSSWAEYETMSGNELSFITLEEADPLEFRFQITTRAGSLAVSVRDSRNEEIFCAEYDKTAAFTLPLEKDGLYAVTMTGNNHTGGYRITWGAPDHRDTAGLPNNPDAPDGNGREETPNRPGAAEPGGPDAPDGNGPKEAPGRKEATAP